MLHIRMMFLIEGLHLLKGRHIIPIIGIGHHTGEPFGQGTQFVQHHLSHPPESGHGNHLDAHVPTPFEEGRNRGKHESVDDEVISLFPFQLKDRGGDIYGSWFAHKIGHQVEAQLLGHRLSVRDRILPKLCVAIEEGHPRSRLLL